MTAEPLHQQIANHINHDNDPTTYHRNILFALQMRPNIYAGTVPVEEIRRRRTKNKAARKARRNNRKANA